MARPRTNKKLVASSNKKGAMFFCYDSSIKNKETKQPYIKVFNKWVKADNVEQARLALQSGANVELR